MLEGTSFDLASFQCWNNKKHLTGSDGMVKLKGIESIHRYACTVGRRTSRLSEVNCLVWDGWQRSQWRTGLSTSAKLQESWLFHAQMGERYQKNTGDFEGRKNTLNVLVTLDNDYRLFIQHLAVKCIVIQSICQQMLGRIPFSALNSRSYTDKELCPASTLP